MKTPQTGRDVYDDDSNKDSKKPKIKNRCISMFNHSSKPNATWPFTPDCETIDVNVDEHIFDAFHKSHKLTATPLDFRFI